MLRILVGCAKRRGSITAVVFDRGATKQPGQKARCPEVAMKMHRRLRCAVKNCIHPFCVADVDDSLQDRLKLSYGVERDPETITIVVF
jgi:hypothetical protein